MLLLVTAAHSPWSCQGRCPVKHLHALGIITCRTCMLETAFATNLQKVDELRQKLDELRKAS
jgi:hypothetical protein